jgi:hypothetical protein
VYYIGSAVKLNNEDPRPSEMIIKDRWQRGNWQLHQRIGYKVPVLLVVSCLLSSARESVTRGPDRGKLKISTVRNRYQETAVEDSRLEKA